MILFLLLLLPLSLIIYVLDVKDKKMITTIFIGAFTAIFVSFCRMFFSFTHRIIPYEFSNNFWYYIIYQNLLPIILLYGIFFLISKDEMEYKIKNIFPLLCSYFAIYLPYCVMSMSEFYYQGYDIFLKPVIYLAMIVQISISGFYLYKSIGSKNISGITINGLLLLVYLFYPAISDALYAIDYNFSVILVLGLIFSILPLFFVVFNFFKKQN